MKVTADEMGVSAYIKSHNVTFGDGVVPKSGTTFELECYPADDSPVVKVGLENPEEKAKAIEFEDCLTHKDMIESGDFSIDSYLCCSHSPNAAYCRALELFLCSYAKLDIRLGDPVNSPEETDNLVFELAIDIPERRPFRTSAIAKPEVLSDFFYISAPSTQI